MWQEIRGSLRSQTWMLRAIVTILLATGIVGVLLAAGFYVFEEILAGLLAIAILCGAGVLVLAVFILLQEAWQYGVHRIGRSKAARHPQFTN